MEETEKKDVIALNNFENCYENFLSRLREHEISTITKYVLVRAPKNFLENKAIPTSNQRLHWQNDVPYYHFGSRIFHCHQGRDSNICKKRKYTEERDRQALEDHSFTKRYKKAQVTKKLECPAKILVARVIRMPELKLPELSKSYQKRKIAELLKMKIENGESFGEEGFMFNLPTIEEHKNHFIGESAAITEPVDSQVRHYISQLVTTRGERNALIISKLLTSYVENELQEKDKMRRRFYPNIGTIRSIIASTKAKIKSPIDQQNLENLINNWDKSDNVFFRPHSEADDAEDARHLLFVYQSKRMQRLYELYGKNSILLDATYRTCKYALPLFFVVVNTNVNYQVVGVIITQFETREAIGEGLSVIKNWNPTIMPKYAMVDFAQEEISSLEDIFPGIKVFICSFHREQAWNRWLSRGCNSAVPRKETLTLLRKIAHAPNIEETFKAIEELKSQDFYDGTTLKSYFEGTWEKELERWATAYKPNDFHINTNNGVERLNKELKYNYLEGFKGCSLTDMVKVVVEDFLPERYKLYMQENMKMSSKYRKYDEEVPNFLSGRPKWFIKLIMHKKELVPSTVSSLVEQVGKCIFKVISFTTNDRSYTVQLDQESSICTCSCKDFAKERIVCKHILSVGLKYPEWKMETINEWLFKDPVYNYDDFFGDDLRTEDLKDPVLDIDEVASMTQYKELPLRGSNRKHLINDCNAILRSLQSVLWNLDEEELQHLNGNLKDIFKSVSAKVSTDKGNGLPVEAETSGKSRINGIPEQKKKYRYRNLAIRKKKTSTKRVGFVADTIEEAKTLNIEEKSPAFATGRKSYSCYCCGKHFIHQSKLIKHVRLHTGERPYQCSYCTKRFLQLSSLKRHKRIHTGVKSLTHICRDSFEQDTHLHKEALSSTDKI